MKLPQEVFNTDDQSYQDLELKFSKKIIRVRKYLTQEIRKYLHAITTQDSEYNRNIETFKLFKACVHPEDHNTVDNMHKADFVFAMSVIRSMSNDPSIFRPHYCPHCNWIYDAYSINILNNTKYDPDTFEEEYEYTIANGDKIIFQQIPYIKELEIIKDREDKNFFETANDMLHYSIKKLVIKNIVYEDVDIDDIKKFIGKNIDPDLEYKQLLKYMGDKKIIFWIEDQRTCKNCNKEYPLTVDEPYFFVNA